MTLLQAPKYFKLKETAPGTVLVERGRFFKEEISQKFGNRQFYFNDAADNKLKCLSGGSLAYLIDLHDINKHKEVKITYAGMKAIENGKYAGTDSHQFEVELLTDTSINPERIKEIQDTMSEPETTSDTPMDDLA